MDFSLEALRHARDEGHFDALVCGDIRCLPFRDESVDGVWNLGVMEHFRRPGGQLRSSCRSSAAYSDAPEVVGALLFWPPTFGLSRWVLGAVRVAGRSLSSLGRTFRFFPDEVFRLPSRAAARQTSWRRSRARSSWRLDFTPRDGFNHLDRRRPAGGAE